MQYAGLAGWHIMGNRQKNGIQWLGFLDVTIWASCCPVINGICGEELQKFKESESVCFIGTYEVPS